MSDNGSIIDYDRTICLCCGAGNPDYLAATAIAADGTEHLVLAERDAIGDENIRYDPTCSTVRHEQTGPLPPGVRYRVWQVPAHRCGRPTKTTGRPCRIEVTRPGEPCGLHRRQAALEPDNGSRP